MGLGAPEIIIILIIVVPFWLLPVIWGYHAGSKRTIGSSVGLLLGLFLSYVGVIIIYCMPKTQQPDFPPYYPGFQKTSAADELQKYKQLLDSGAITEQEYNIQKARILK